jgi:hypothetical protein
MHGNTTKCAWEENGMHGGNVGIILSRDPMTTDRSWTGNWIYLPLPQLGTIEITVTHRAVFSVTLPGSGLQQRSLLGFHVQQLPFSLAGTAAM